MSRAPCRIDGLVATEANSAVILRRGPAQYTQLLVWDFDNDEILPGQWLRARIYTRRCDVSPDGKHLVIAAADHRIRRTIDGEGWEQRGNWTAVSRPPYFTAVALWQATGSYGGGGVWISNDCIALNPAPFAWRELLPLPPQIKVQPFDNVAGRSFPGRLFRKGWTEVQAEVDAMDYPVKGYTGVAEPTEKWLRAVYGYKRAITQTPQVVQKQIRNGFLRGEQWNGVFRWSAHDEAGVEVRSWVETVWSSHWVDSDGRGRLVFAEGGCLWAWQRFPDGEPTKIADLNDNVFERVEPPEWAKSW